MSVLPHKNGVKSCTYLVLRAPNARAKNVWVEALSQLCYNGGANTSQIDFELRNQELSTRSVPGEHREDEYNLGHAEFTNSPTPERQYNIILDSNGKAEAIQRGYSKDEHEGPVSEGEKARASEGGMKKELMDEDALNSDEGLVALSAAIGRYMQSVSQRWAYAIPKAIVHLLAGRAANDFEDALVERMCQLLDTGAFKGDNEPFKHPLKETTSEEQALHRKEPGKKMPSIDSGYSSKADSIDLKTTSGMASQTGLSIVASA